MDAVSNGPQFIGILESILNKEPISCSAIRCSGGDTHLSYQLRIKAGDKEQRLLFAKINSLDRYPLLESESLSLKILNNDYGLNYPKPIGLEKDDSYGYLVLEHYDLSSISASRKSADVGTDLANLLVTQHKITSQYFGWPVDNYIGLTKQINLTESDWVQFYRSKRLSPQLEWARYNGLTSELQARISKLIVDISRYFVGYAPSASLLHGDLWSGNVGFDNVSGLTMLFDPAPYFGDRECDIAFAELFGGFPPEFFNHYNKVLPLHENYSLRRPIYNLYHALNHFNLFGPCYLDLIKDQLAQIQEL